MPRTVLSRPRLSAVIADSLANNDLVVLRSPAGSGKTVALADWAVSGLTKGHISWVTLGEEYADRTMFWQEMIIGTELRVDPPLRPFIKECAEALVAGADPRTVLRRFVPYVPETVLVIDRLDTITDQNLLDDMVWALKTSRNIKVLVASRSRTSLDIPELALDFDVAYLGQELLHLTPEETAELLELRGSSVDPAELHAATGGHPLLTRATLAVHDTAGRDGIAASARTAVSDFLKLSLTGTGLSEDVKDFMVLTSIPESFSDDLAQQLCGMQKLRGTQELSALLDELEDKGLGLRFKFRDHIRFRYTAAVRTMLAESRSRLDPREIDRLTRIVIDHELAASNIVNALRLAFSINDLDLASTIACDHHMTLLVSQMAPVREILESVPLPRLRKHPALIMALALCYNSTSGGRIRARELFGLAAVFARMYRAGMDTAQRLWTITMESTSLRFAGNLEPALKQAQTAVQGFEESPMEVRERLAPLEPTLYTQSAIAYIHNQQFGAAAQLLFKALDAGRRTSALPAIFLATGLLAFALALDGNIPESIHYLSWLDETRWPPGMEGGYWAMTYRLAQTRVAMDQQDYPLASACLGRINEEMQNSEFWPHYVAFNAYLDLQRTGSGAGPVTLETKIRRAHRAPVNNSGLIELDCLRASIYLIAGQPDKAAGVVDKYTRPDARLLLMRARIALYQGQPSKTLSITGRGLSNLGPRLEVHRLLLRSAAFRRVEDAPAALDHARAAASLMSLYGLTMTNSLVPQNDLPALTSAVRQFVPDMVEPVEIIPIVTDSVPLTPRERVVLQALADHGSATEVAKHLSVSLNTVKSQSRSINKKLGTSSRAEAITRARSLGLLDD